MERPQPLSALARRQADLNQRLARLSRQPGAADADMVAGLTRMNRHAAEDLRLLRRRLAVEAWRGLRPDRRLRQG